MRRSTLVALGLSLMPIYVASSAPMALAQDTQPATTPADTQQDSKEAQNKRAAALEGSKSPWSGQLIFTYTGSSYDHPFSKETANPSHQPAVPPVNLSGVSAIRYRFDKTTTAGVGFGLTTETPFQGQKHTTAADPQIDIAKSFTLGPIHNRADFTLLRYTSHSESVDYGELNNLDITTESFYESQWGGTIGLALEYDYNMLKNGSYDPENQIISDYYLMPYLEYAINDTFNLRTIVHAVANQTRAQKPGTYQHPDITQNLGLGISASKAVYLYIFAAFDPYAKNTKIASDTTTFGFQTIINLF